MNVLIYFRDYHNDGCDRIVQATEEEWRQLIRRAVDRGCPIDDATVDKVVLKELYARSAVDLPLSEVLKIERVIPLV